MDQRTAAGEQVRPGPAHRHDEDEDQRRQPDVAFSDEITAGGIVDEPAEREPADPEEHGLPGLERHHRRVDQVQARLPVVDPDKSAKPEIQVQ